MSGKLPDTFQIREHSWPCLFHIIVIYDRLASIFFTHRNHDWGLIHKQILHYWPSKQVFDDNICVNAQILMISP